MLPLLLALLLTTAPTPCSPKESTAACKCKQGSATACEALRQSDPKLVAELEKAAARSERAPAQQAQAAASATGQQHHVISHPIAKELAKHPRLGGHYTARDPRFVIQGTDKAAHNGYQHWHREVDKEVVAWLKRYRDATPEQFEAFLRSIYARPEMRARFPHGF